MPKFNIYFILFLFSLTACNLEKDIEVELPPHDPKLVVECYLEVGKPYRLVLSETIPFDVIPTTLPTVDGAIVVISYNGTNDTLSNGLFIDPVAEKFFNYGSSTIVPEDFVNTYTLSITDSTGRNVTASTKILPIVPIDSVVYNFNDTDTLASIQTWFTDLPAQDNFYRHTLHKGSLDNNPDQVFALDDRVFDGDDVVFGTGFDYVIGDTIITAIYHIDLAYHDFLETVEAASDSNGNPFAQPSFILSNIENGIGIFTGLTFDRDTIYITQ